MVSPNSIYWCPYRKRKIWTERHRDETIRQRHTQREGSNMNTEAETVMLPSNYLGFPEVGGGKEESSPTMIQ